MVGAGRQAGLPADYPNDVVYRTSFLGRELARIRIPCRAERYAARQGPDTGRSLYDALGPYCTLLRLDPGIDLTGLTRAAADIAMLLAMLDLSAAELPEIVKHRLVLVRSDQHIAWRGHAPPADSVGLVNILRGAHRTANGD